MSLRDFDMLTPEEFRTIYRSWNEKEERRITTFLSAVRIHAATVIAPHVKKIPALKDIISIPSIDESKGEEAPQLTKEERESQYQQLKQLRGYGHKQSDNIDKL